MCVVADAPAGRIFTIVNSLFGHLRYLRDKDGSYLLLAEGEISGVYEMHKISFAEGELGKPILLEDRNTEVLKSEGGLVRLAHHHNDNAGGSHTPPTSS